MVAMALIATDAVCGTLRRQENDSAQHVRLNETVVTAQSILGSKFRAAHRTGSAYYLSPDEIKKLGYTDINRMLKAVPGVNTYEEDGFGLRPNISLRGTKAERSERISLMEDGILAAPAPYSAPAAYYFPNAARMFAVEVLKGSSQVQYGPFTTGGAINMVSTPVPNRFTGRIEASLGSYGTFKSHLHVGNTAKHVGYLIEYLRYQSDGFKKYAFGNAKGFERNDLIAKLLLKTDKTEGLHHSLELKFGYADEQSDETYVGLSENDFRVNPYLRYAGSQMDEMTTRHKQYVATYQITSAGGIKLTSSAYYNHFYRNWYKLNDIRAGFGSKQKRTLEQVLADPETNHLYFDILTGKSNYDGEGLIVRANQRTYRSRGVQTKMDYHLNSGDCWWDLELGLRFHKDEEDRFQWDDGYSMQSGKMQMFLPGIHGMQANRITSASAFAGYGLAKLKYKKLSVSAGVRYEDIDLLKKDYTKADIQRTGKVREETPNHARVLIPSLGINYQIMRELSAFVGVHKGFAPPSAELYQEAEKSLNTETGIRLFTGNLRIELIGFYNYYSNMLGSDLAAAGGQGTLDQFNVGEARVKGAEFLFQYQPLPQWWHVKLPLQLSYTYTTTEMRNAFESSSWGIVAVGDAIPYIYKHSLNAQLGIEYKGFEANLGINHKGDMRTAPGQGVIANSEKVPAHTIWDASAKMKINKHFRVMLNAVNLTNARYLVSRHPAGLRAGHPLGISLGVSATF